MKYYDRVKIFKNSTANVSNIQVLTLASAAEVSVSLGENGWAWLVTGRRLVLWRGFN